MYENVTYEVILQRMLDRISSRLDRREGSVIFDALSPAAIELQILYIELNTILREAFGDTASREFLILRCRERGITPREATKAILQGEFIPTSLNLRGKRFNVNEMNYIVREQMSPGRYRVECEAPGAIGNRYLGSMVPIEYIPGLETAELTSVLIPGEDEEETEALRERYLHSFRSQAFGGNRRDYTEKVTAIQGVGSVKVEIAWNSDVRPSEYLVTPAITAWYGQATGNAGQEPKEWLTKLYNAAKDKKLTSGGAVRLTILDSVYNKASGTLIQTVQEAIDPEGFTGEGMGLAPIGHVVSVRTAEEVAIHIYTQLTFGDGHSFTSLKTAIEDTIKQYLLELRRGWADEDYLVVRISQCETRMLAIPGIVDITGTTINGSGNNLNLTAYQIPVFGGVTQ